MSARSCHRVRNRRLPDLETFCTSQHTITAHATLPGFGAMSFSDGNCYYPVEWLNLSRCKFPNPSWDHVCHEHLTPSLLLLLRGNDPLLSGPWSGCILRGRLRHRRDAPVRTAVLSHFVSQHISIKFRLRRPSQRGIGYKSGGYQPPSLTTKILSCTS